MNMFLKGMLAFALVVCGVVSADQLENEAKEAALSAPKGVLVKVNPETKTVEVFKAPTLNAGIVNNTASSDQTADTIRALENPANKIAEFKLTKNELDKEASTEAWYRRWYSYSWNWNSWGGYRPYYYNWYQPYSYYPGYFNYGYNYSYYYRWNYGYNNCYYGWYY